MVRENEKKKRKTFFLYSVVEFSHFFSLLSIISRRDNRRFRFGLTRWKNLTKKMSLDFVAFPFAVRWWFDVQKKKNFSHGFLAKTWKMFGELLIELKIHWLKERKKNDKLQTEIIQQGKFFKRKLLERKQFEFPTQKKKKCAICVIL